jgi:hypothetical protein
MNGTQLGSAKGTVGLTCSRCHPLSFTITPTMSSTDGPKKGCVFPIEILYLIGLQLLPEEPFLTSANDYLQEDWDVCVSTLRDLALTCRAVYDSLEPLLHRFIILRNGHDIVRAFTLLAKNPTARNHVRHLLSDTSEVWETIADGLPEWWERRHGKDKKLQQVLDEAGYSLTPEQIDEITHYTRIEPDFHSHDAVMFAYGGILLMAAELETLTMNREITRHSYMVIARNILIQSQEDHPILPKLRAIKLITKYTGKDRGDGMETFMRSACIFSWPVRILIVKDVNASFISTINSLSLHYGVAMPLVERLHIRPWDTPRELRFKPVNDIPVLLQLPVFFPNLRVIDVEFIKTPNFEHDLWESIGGLSESLEKMRLKNQKFSMEMMLGQGMKKLRLLSIDLCRGTPDNPDVNHVLSIFENAMEEGYFKHRALERLELNGSIFSVKVEGPGLPQVSLLDEPAYGDEMWT